MDWQQGQGARGAPGMDGAMNIAVMVDGVRSKEGHIRIPGQATIVSTHLKTGAADGS